MKLTNIGQFLKQWVHIYCNTDPSNYFTFFSQSLRRLLCQQCRPKDDAAEISIGQSMLLNVLTQSSKVQLFLWTVSSMKPSTTSPSKNLNARCGLWLQHQKQLQIRISPLSFVANTIWKLSFLHSQRGLPYGKCFCLMLIQKKTLWFSAPLHECTDSLVQRRQTITFRWNCIKSLCQPSRLGGPGN